MEINILAQNTALKEFFITLCFLDLCDPKELTPLMFLYQARKNVRILNRYYV